MLDRTSSAPGNTVLDFANLLGDVNLDRASGRKRHYRGQLLRRYGAQAMGCDAHIAARELPGELAAGVNDAREALEIRHETALARARLERAEAAMGIKSWQQREGDAGLGGSGGHAPAELAGVGERQAGFVLMQVVKLADARKTGLEHLRECQRGDRLELIRVHPLDEPVHELAPGPEAVRRGAATLREPRDGTLKSVAVEVGQPGDSDGVPLITVSGVDVRLDGKDVAVLPGDAHVPGPSAGQQGRFEPESGCLPAHPRGRPYCRTARSMRCSLRMEPAMLMSCSAMLSNTSSMERTPLSAPDRSTTGTRRTPASCM